MSHDHSAHPRSKDIKCTESRNLQEEPICTHQSRAHTAQWDYAPIYSLKHYQQQQQHQQPEVSEYRHRRQQRREVHEEHHGRRHHSASSSASSATATAARYEVTSTAVHHGHGSLNRRDNYRRHERQASLETFKPNNSGRL